MLAIKNSGLLNMLAVFGLVVFIYAVGGFMVKDGESTFNYKWPVTLFNLKNVK